MRVLFIARYRDPTMHRKVEHMAQTGDLLIRHIFPGVWQDDLLRVDQQLPDMPGLQRRTTGMIGSPIDPHRSFYRSLTLGIPAFRPHIIHAEEEPDSLAALQIVLCRRLFAPQAKLFLHTWQNVDRPLSLPVRAVLAATLAAADAIFCANREAVELLQQRRYLRPMPVIPAVGVDTEQFCPRLPKTSERFRVGYIGRLIPEKGIDILLQAAARLADGCQVVIVGGGPEESFLRQQVEALELGDQVQFVASVPTAQIAGVLGGLDALVLPSRSTTVWKEQMGRVLLEAMAVGVPVIGSDSGAIPEVIGEAGLIFPEGDVDALATRLVELMSRSELSRELIRRGQARVNALYSQKKLAARTVEFYRRMGGIPL
ncbi:MAG: glycosyltransferase family 4 protein [Caldilineaceae bacterium]|nr:glycosyltransferase family 4 protein [Caldilineaceae bacterium]